ncbi:MAG: hypothetical protein DRJ30_05830 [Candidatus Methanomethylicota archaeon]|nr:MAG: hypothetical protein DRJ30_05830 [Candidatus Verstraetearchaeota archaeon]
MAAVIQKHYYKYDGRISPIEKWNLIFKRRSTCNSRNGMYIIVENDPIWGELIVEMHISDVVNVAKEIKGRSAS